MHNRISAESTSEDIRALRENGTEPIFSVDESKTLGDLLSEIDWNLYSEVPEKDGIFESTREPVFHLDEDPEEQVPPAPRRTREDILSFSDW